MPVREFLSISLQEVKERKFAHECQGGTKEDI